ncbi:MAG: IS66 family transposase zinc-finger binding domain-containing protein, partial [Flavobacteriales bacterium]|nr:IS66 family transposase zinc-finger binding domain-containing protein [Flavobacteriales bacterium]
MSSEEKKDILIDQLLKKIQKLEERLDKFENKKSSKNSSVPPSQDPNRIRKTKSLRQKSGKKPLGQKGHKGSTLEMVANPDEIIDLSPNFCNKCGSSLSSIPSEFISKRQITDIPPIDIKYTEYRVFEKTCTCGCQNKSSFPSDVNSPIGYGPNIQSHIAYLHTRQYVPYQRM